MTAIGFVTLILFLAGWVGGLVSWVYGAYHLFMSRVRWHDLDRSNRHSRKAIRAGAVFLGFWLLGFASGVIGDSFGGWGALTSRQHEPRP